MGEILELNAPVDVLDMAEVGAEAVLGEFHLGLSEVVGGRLGRHHRPADCNSWQSEGSGEPRYSS